MPQNLFSSQPELHIQLLRCAHGMLWFAAALHAYYKLASSTEPQTFSSSCDFSFSESDQFHWNLRIQEGHLWAPLPRLNALLRGSIDAGTLLSQRIHVPELSPTAYLSIFLISFLHPWAQGLLPLVSPQSLTWHRLLVAESSLTYYQEDAYILSSLTQRISLSVSLIYSGNKQILV